jgi:hypothetical protein
MKKIIILLLLLFLAGCVCQPPMQIMVPRVKKVILGGISYSPNSFYPELTRGYIENQSWPYVSKVWLLSQGKKILLVGKKDGPPDNVRPGEINEFNFPPQKHLLLVERWRYLHYYGGWKKIGEEKINLQIARSCRLSEGHYGWYVVIGPKRTYIRD